MKTHRELLALAAKAAGFEIWWRGDRAITQATGYWNPIDDDGDALRLAVVLKFQVTLGTYRDHEVTVFNDRMVEVTEHVHYQQDMMAAARLAIVRVAAAIGEAMP